MKLSLWTMTNDRKRKMAVGRKYPHLPGDFSFWFGLKYFLNITYKMLENIYVWLNSDLFVCSFSVSMRICVCSKMHVFLSTHHICSLREVCFSVICFNYETKSGRFQSKRLKISSSWPCPLTKAFVVCLPTSILIWSLEHHMVHLRTLDNVPKAWELLGLGVSLKSNTQPPPRKALSNSGQNWARIGTALSVSTRPDAAGEPEPVLMQKSETPEDSPRAPPQLSF